MPIIDPNDVLVVERGDTVAPITLKLSDTNAALSRLHEIRNTNAATFPELAATFIQASNELFQALATVRQELVKTEHRAGLLRAKLLVEDVPALLQSKGLKHTIDTCNALIDLDPEFSKISYTRDLLHGALLILENKLVTLKSAQFAIRDIARLSWDNRNNVKTTLEPLGQRRSSQQPDAYDLGEY